MLFARRTQPRTPNLRVGHLWRDKWTISGPLSQPRFLEGVKSKGKAILKMANVYFSYPGVTTPTVRGISLQVPETPNWNKSQHTPPLLNP